MIGDDHFQIGGNWFCVARCTSRLVASYQMFEKETNSCLKLQELRYELLQASVTVVDILASALADMCIRTESGRLCLEVVSRSQYFRKKVFQRRFTLFKYVFWNATHMPSLTFLYEYKDVWRCHPFPAWSGNDYVLCIVYIVTNEGFAEVETHFEFHAMKNTQLNVGSQVLRVVT